MTNILKNNLIDIDGNNLFLLDDNYCKHIHTYQKDGLDHSNIILKDEILKYLNIRILYQTILYDYDYKLSKFICSIEDIKLNSKENNVISNIYKETSYKNYNNKNLIDEDMYHVSELLYIQEEDTIEKLLKNNKHYFLTIPFKDKNTYCKFRLLSK